MNIDELFYCHFRDFRDYPFDMPKFCYTFELTGFELEMDGKVETFRFDFFRQWMNEIFWHPNSKFLPEFEIDYRTAKMVTLVDSRPFGNKNKKAFNYPGFKFKFRVMRDPLPRIITNFFPTIVLGVLVTSIFGITRHDLNNRLTNLSVSLLTVIAIMQDGRGAIPEIGASTFSDRFVIPYILMSLLPFAYI